MGSYGEAHYPDNVSFILDRNIFEETNYFLNLSKVCPLATAALAAAGTIMNLFEAWGLAGLEVTRLSCLGWGRNCLPWS